MIGVHFDKEKAESFLKSLKHGLAIRPPDGRGWTVFDMLALAGACHFAVMSNTPSYTESGEAADWDSAIIDVGAAIEWLSNASMLVQDGEYDEGFEAHHEAAIICKDGKKTVRPLAGFKQEA